jgi:uncharacterized protein (TIGR00251 family)
VRAPQAHFRWEGEDLLLSLKGKPGARREAFGRVMQGRLAVHVAAVAADGRATARLLEFLAQAFGVPKSAVELLYGPASVNKQVRVHAPQRLPPQACVTPRRS